ncbi:hypothetical protein [Actinomadura sp. WMMA1423]|uniref:hypothetical protein n=1 Tax=Actinomadura sp. WMMA1423 TaxID=2591108 RepID=UPI00114727FF|nr:hypothetical protein [Actinomadura sp. WMMA1423]
MSDYANSSARLAALCVHLKARGLDVTHNGHLTVRVEGEVPRAVHITCRPREKDGGALWFWTHWGEPLAEAHDVISAAVAITGLLAVRT